MNDTEYSNTKEKLQALANGLATHLAHGSRFHAQAQSSAIKNNLRGLARWHELESQGDFEAERKASKFIIDNLKIHPKIDMSMVNEANKYTFNSKNDLKEHLEYWNASEKEFISFLQNGIKTLSDLKVTGELYSMLREFLIEVENEKLYISILHDVLQSTDFSPFSVQFNMRILHEYFENKDGGRIDFTLI